VVAPFRAQTQQTIVRGTGAWISYEGGIYQLLGYAVEPVYEQLRPALQQTIGSFAPLTDPEVLGVQPDRIRIVEVPERMTLAQFNARFPSAIPIEELAVINRIPTSESAIPAGTRLKRVVRE